MVISYEMGWLLNCATVMIPIKKNFYMMKTTFFFFFVIWKKPSQVLHEWNALRKAAELVGLKLKHGDRCGPTDVPYQVLTDRGGRALQKESVKSALAC